MPSNESSGKENMWYTFQYSNIQFIMINTETDYPNAPEGTNLFGDQLSWLEEQLIQANSPQNRSLRPWLIVGGHRPIYSSANFFSDQNGIPIFGALYEQQAFEDLFMKYHVDVFIVGHVHAYERCYSTYKSKVMTTNYTNPIAPVYIICGAAGTTEGLSNDMNSSWINPPPTWSAFRYGLAYGYGILDVFSDVQGQTHFAKWSFIRSSDNVILDEFVLTKSQPI